MSDEAKQPGHGRRTADAAFAALTKAIGERNEAASRVARKLRDAREQSEAAKRRERDLR